MLKVRTRFQERGLSFAIHSDAAWGGYFASFVGDMDKFIPSKPLYLVPAMTLSPHPKAQLSVLGLSDSITIDPHKYATLTESYRETCSLSLLDRVTQTIPLAVSATATGA
jgi:hypothetical protein